MKNFIKLLFRFAFERGVFMSRNDTIFNFGQKYIEQREDMTFNFSQKYAEQIEKYESTIYQTASAIGGTGVRWLKKATKDEIKTKIFLCDNRIKAFENFKKFCYRKGKSGMYYFQDMWEKLHNSKKTSFSYIDSVLVQKSMLEKALKEK